MKPKIYKCCVCKKSGGGEFSYFHHFTPKMKERYQCINCRCDNDPKQIAAFRKLSRLVKKQIKFLESLSK